VVGENASNEWLVAFQEHDGSAVNDDWDIPIYRIGGSSSGASATLTADAADVSQHKIGPQLAGGDGRFLLTYATQPFDQLNPKPTGVAGQVVRAQRIDCDFSSGTFTLPHAPVDLLTIGVNGLRNEGLAFDSISGDHWCAGLRRPSNGSYQVFKLGHTGNVVESSTINLVASATASAMAISFHVDQREFPLVFAENDGTTTGNPVYGTAMVYDPVTPPTPVGFACGSGAWANTAAIADKQQIGAEGMPLQLAGAPLDTAALLFLSLGSLPIETTVLGAPGCWLYPDLNAPNYLGAVTSPIVAGAASTVLDLPESLAPVTLTMQWIYLVPNANPLWLLSSQGLNVQLGR
jgi:hypothetical protein